MKELYDFNNDKFKREELFININSYLNAINKQGGVSFGINAKWGDGKTYFINMFKNEIDKEKKDFAVYYNAWENDSYDSAVIPLLYNIISAQEKNNSEVFIESAKFFLKTLGIYSLKIGLNRYVNELQDLWKIFSDEIKNKNNNIDVFKEYDIYYGKRLKLIDILKKNIPKDGKLWIFIDDLDRCNPKFMIDTLESIKNFFSIDNIVFIFTIDYNQLIMALKQVYGSLIDSDSYAKKFFDVIWFLPPVNLYEYIKIKINNDIFKNIDVDFLISTIKKFNCSLRDVDSIINHIEYFFYRFSGEILDNVNYKISLKVYLYFICLKEKYNNYYIDVIHGRFSIDSNNKKFEKINSDFLFDEDINSLLKKISGGNCEKYYMDILKKFKLIEKEDFDTFSEYMNYFII